LIVVAPLVPPGRLFLPVAASNSLRHFASNALSGLRLSFVATDFVSHAVMQVVPSAYAARPAENGVQALACPSMPYTLKSRLPFSTSPKKPLSCVNDCVLNTVSTPLAWNVSAAAALSRLSSPASAASPLSSTLLTTSYPRFFNWASSVSAAALIPGMLLERIPIFAVLGTTPVLATSAAAAFAATSAGRPMVSRFLPDAFSSWPYAMSPEIKGVLLSTLMHGIDCPWNPLPLITTNGLLSIAAAVHALSNDVASIGSHPTAFTSILR